MKKGLILIYLVLFFTSFMAAQHPNWGTVIALDKAPLIVIGTMQIEDSLEGLGTLKVLQTLKGKAIKDIKVQFSNKHPREGFHKHEEAPKYWYNDQQEGIWLLIDSSASGRYNLRQANLYYEKKWQGWIKDKLKVLEQRKWSTNNKGLIGSVIIDDVGNNQFYRFFYICLKNNSEKTIYINTHYRIQDSLHGRLQAQLITPSKESINMVTGNQGNCRLSGEPGWPIPMTSDFKALKPGDKIYLAASGDLKCFLKNSPEGVYTFKSAYQNDYKDSTVKGNIWTGKIDFPMLKFNYKESAIIKK